MIIIIIIINSIILVMVVATTIFNQISIFFPKTFSTSCLRLTFSDRVSERMINARKGIGRRF